MSKRRITPEEINHVITLARSGMHSRAIARASTVSTQGIHGICQRAGVKLKHGKRGPIRKEAK